MKTFYISVFIALELIVLAMTTMLMTLVSNPSKLIHRATRFVTRIDDIIEMIDVFLAANFKSNYETYTEAKALIYMTNFVIW